MLEDLTLGYVGNSFSDSPYGTAKVFFFPGCNKRCGYCYNSSVVYGKIENGIKFSDALKEVAACKQTREDGKTFLTNDWIILSGGECTLYPDHCKALIDEANKIGIGVGIYTNGVLGDVVMQLRNYGLQYIHLDIKDENFNTALVEKLNHTLVLTSYATVLVKQTFPNVETFSKLRDKLFETGYKPSSFNTWTLNAFSDNDGQATMLDPTYTKATSFIDKKTAYQMLAIARSHVPFSNDIRLIGYKDYMTTAQMRDAKQKVKASKENKEDDYSRLTDLDSYEYEVLCNNWDNTLSVSANIGNLRLKANSFYSLHTN